MRTRSGRPPEGTPQAYPDGPWYEICGRPGIKAGSATSDIAKVGVALQHHTRPRGAQTPANSPAHEGSAVAASPATLDPLAQIEACVPALRRYAWSLLRSPDDADDLVHDCLVRALDKLGTRREDADIRAWLFTIMHNLFVSQYRR